MTQEGEAERKRGEDTLRVTDRDQALSPVFRTVLLASDLTELSSSALRVAVALAREHAARVVALNVADETERAKHWLVPFFAEELTYLRAFLRRQEEAALEKLRGQVRAAGADFECVFRWGHPADTIVAEATLRAADLIVVGTRGTPLGSVAERVVRMAQRPVLVVPPVTVQVSSSESPRRTSESS